tara:strand:- start:311 stop:649 length:339 start_codon:yes stop_codon:yes gene_type:complete
VKIIKQIIIAISIFGFLYPCSCLEPPPSEEAYMDADVLGGSDGEEMHQLTEDEMPSHSHSLTQSGGSSSAGGSRVSRGGTGDATTINTSSSGQNLSNNNMPPFISFNYIIKY